MKDESKKKHELKIWHEIKIEGETPNSKIFKQKYKQTNNYSRVTVWRCKTCPREIKKTVLYNSTHTFFQTDSQETHSCTTSNPVFITDVEDEIFSLLKTKILSPKSILNIINKEEKKTNIRQVYYLKQKYSKSKEKKTLHVVDVIEKLKQSKDNTLSHYSADPFKLILSDKRLLHKLKDGKFYHADFAFKVCDPDMPLLIIGVSDSSKKFHLISMIITKNETHEVFKNTIKIINGWCEKENIKLNIRSFTTDMGKQFKNFEDFRFVKLDCWAHTKNLIHSDTKKFSMKNQILSDIDFLQIMPSENMFKRAYILFEKKYKQFEDDDLEKFLIDFEAKIIETCPNWYEGVGVFAPSTNNALESFNRHLKYNILNEMVVPLLDFIDISEKLFDEENKKYFVTSPQYSIETTEKKFLLVKKYKSEESEYEQHVFKNNDDAEETENITKITKIQDFNNIQTLKEMKQLYNIYSIVSSKETPTSYLGVFCSCFTFLKNKACYHCFEIFKQKRVLDLISMPIKSNKSRGRPKKITNKTDSKYFSTKNK